MAEANEPEVKAAFKDPKPSVERMSQLAGRVLTGDILLPKFQRDFVWPRDKVLGLVDSIGRNYPIGSILLWQSRQELASERSIAGLDIAATKPDYPVNYLLDGQQRLSTVCGVLYWQPKDDPDSLWNVVYDLRTMEFTHLHTLDDPPLSQVPLRYLSDAATFFKRVGALDDADLRAEADRLFNRFSDYMIAAVTLGDMSIEDIAPIFERINSTATPLTIVDLMRAATWDPEFDLRDAIDGVLTKLSDRHYQTVDRKTILRAVSAAAGYGFSVDDIEKLRTKSSTDLSEVVVSVEEGAKLAVDFLTNHIGAPEPKSLPYANQFAVLTELFRRSPTTSSAHFAAIERWFWRTTLSGYFGGWNTGQMGRDWREVIRFTEDATATEIDVPAALPRHDVWRLTQFRSNSAVSKMLALMMSYAAPVDLLTGQSLELRKSLSWSNDREFHHLFPKAHLAQLGITDGRANPTANMVLLSSASNIHISADSPSSYLGELIDEVGRVLVEERLASVLVPAASLDAALEDDYDGFIEARSRFLHENALRLVGEETGDAGPATTPDPTAVLVSDEAPPDDDP
jgi:hypothetical protein